MLESEVKSESNESLESMDESTQVSSMATRSTVSTLASDIPSTQKSKGTQNFIGIVFLGLFLVLGLQFWQITTMRSELDEIKSTNPDQKKMVVSQESGDEVESADESPFAEINLDKKADEVVEDTDSTGESEQVSGKIISVNNKSISLPEGWQVTSEYSLTESKEPYFCWNDSTSGMADCEVVLIKNTTSGVEAAISYPHMMSWAGGSIKTYPKNSSTLFLGSMSPIETMYADASLTDPYTVSICSASDICLSSNLQRMGKDGQTQLKYVTELIQGLRVL